MQIIPQLKQRINRSYRVATKGCLSLVLVVITYSVIAQAPANDNCSGALTIPISNNGLASCATSVNTTSATASHPGLDCSGTATRDVWYTFTAAATSHTLVFSNSSVVYVTYEVYSGSCGLLSPGSPTNGCAYSTNNSTHTITGLTPGNTYIIRFYEWYGNGATFDINLYGGTPVNDDCASATPLVISSDRDCNSTTCITTQGATESYPGQQCQTGQSFDVWYSFTATNYDHHFTVSNSNTQYVIIELHSTTCGAINPTSPSECVFTNLANTSESDEFLFENLTIGNTYYVRLYRFNDNSAPANFEICMSTTPPCASNPNTNDYCEGAATLTQGGAGWSSSTFSYYTSSTPYDLEAPDAFCGGPWSVDNESWYQFTASSTTEVFTFSSVTNCVNGDGIQAVVFDVSFNSNGCCQDFTEVSNCVEEITTSATVTATGLTVGQDYYLVVDGSFGDQCDFTVNGWDASGIVLPVTLLNFDGNRNVTDNHLFWATASEINNDYFMLERSFDGIHFSPIHQVAGAGNSSSMISYNYTDTYVNADAYYRLKQVDFNGNSETFELVFLAADLDGINVYINGENNIAIDFMSSESADYKLTIYNTLGQIVIQKDLQNIGKDSKHAFDISSYANGLYMISLESLSSNRVPLITKLIK